MEKRAQFNQSCLAWILILPQLVITLVFFIWPALMALYQSVIRGDAFGINHHFYGLMNFIDVLSSESYRVSLAITLLFSILVAFSTLFSGLLMAALVQNVAKGRGFFKTVFIWPYAVAPAIAGLLFRFLFNPAVGILTWIFNKCGYEFNYMLHPGQALFVVVIAASWQQFSYNFLFFLAGLQAIPQSVIEAATIDGANAWQRFWSIIFPLLSPTSFFLLVMNLIYSFFDTFGIIQVMTQGGPANATNTLVYKVYNDGFIGLDMGSSAAQSVILMLIVSLLTVVQFKFIERKVHY